VEKKVWKKENKKECKKLTDSVPRPPKTCEDQDSCTKCFNASPGCSWTIVSDRSGNSVGNCSSDPCTNTPNNDGRRSLSLILCGHGVSEEEQNEVEKKVWKKENKRECKKLIPPRPPKTCHDRSGDCVDCLKSSTSNKKNNDEECFWFSQANKCGSSRNEIMDIGSIPGSLSKKEAKKECKVLHDGGDSDEGGDGNSDSDSEDEDKDEDEATVGGKNDDGPIRHLEGYRNRMPTICMDCSGSGGGGGGRDYIILGSHDAWKSSQPSLLTIIDDSEGTETTTTATTRSREVEKETYDYMSRGWSLEKDGTFNGLVKLENGENITVIVTVSTVY